MNRLDSLICDVAGLPIETGDVAIGLDPDGELLRFVVNDASAARILVFSRDYAQARDAAGVREQVGVRNRAGVREQVLAPDIRIAGIDGDLFLPDFCSAVQAQIGVLLTHMPKSLAELDYVATTTARFAHPAGVMFVAGENNKHLSRSHNKVLSESFVTVHGSRGQGKFRCIVGEGSANDAAKSMSRLVMTSAAGLSGVGGVFSGAKPDAGGEFLAARVIADLEKRELDARNELQILDLGTGNGSVSWDLLFATRAQVIATDIASDAIVTATENLGRFGSRVAIVWDDAASTIDDESVDVVVLNPPFHQGFAVNPALVGNLLAAAYRVLKPGGLLYVVHNSHLRYRQQMSALFTDIQQLGRNTTFTVLVGTKQS